MKTYFIAIVTFVLLVLGMSSANAVEPPNGEEQIVTLNVPYTENNCAFTPSDISGLEDVYVPYGDESALVAIWTIVEDAEGFAVTAVLQSKFYSLNNPLNPGRSTSATFLIPRCAPVEIPSDEEVIIPPVVAPPAEITPPLLPAPHGEPLIPAPVAPVLPAPVEVEVKTVPAPVEAPVTTVEAATVAPVEVEPASVTAPTELDELAATGANETLAFIAFALLFAGIGMVLLNRKLKS